MRWNWSQVRAASLVLILTLGVGSMGAGCAASGASVGHVTATWAGPAADPAVRIRTGTTGRHWWPRYEFAFHIDDDTSLSVDRDAAAAILLRQRDGAEPVVVKIGSPDEPTTVNVRRIVTATGTEQFVCRLFTGAIQVFIAHGERPAGVGRESDAVVVVEVEDDREALRGLSYRSPARAARADALSAPLMAGGLAAGGGGDPRHVVYLGPQDPRPIKIRGGGTVFAVGWVKPGNGAAADGAAVYAGCERDSQVVARRGDEPEVVVPPNSEIQWMKAPRGDGVDAGEAVGPLTGRYDHVVNAIRALNAETPDELSRRLSSIRRYESAAQSTQRVAGIGRSFTGTPRAFAGRDGGQTESKW